MISSYSHLVETINRNYADRLRNLYCGRRTDFKGSPASFAQLASTIPPHATVFKVVVLTLTPEFNEVTRNTQYWTPSQAIKGFARTLTFDAFDATP